MAMTVLLQDGSNAHASCNHTATMMHSAQSGAMCVVQASEGAWIGEGCPHARRHHLPDMKCGLHPSQCGAMLAACHSLNDAQDLWTEGTDEAGSGAGTERMTGSGRIEAEMLGVVDGMLADLDPGLGQNPDRAPVADPDGPVALAFLAPLMLAPLLSVPNGLVHVQVLTAVIETGPLTDILEIPTGTIDHIIENAFACVPNASLLHASAP